MTKNEIMKRERATKWKMSRPHRSKSMELTEFQSSVGMMAVLMMLVRDSRSAVQTWHWIFAECATFLGRRRWITGVQSNESKLGHFHGSSFYWLYVSTQTIWFWVRKLNSNTSPILTTSGRDWYWEQSLESEFLFHWLIFVIEQKRNLCDFYSNVPSSIWWYFIIYEFSWL